MKRPVTRVGALSAASVLCIAFSPYLSAQSVPAAPAASAGDTASEDETIVLSPFVVSSTDSQDGYQVKDTLGGTRVRTNMGDVASALQVIPKQLMQDVGITNAQQLLVYTTNTEVSGLNGNFSGVSSRGSGVQGNAEQGRLGNPNSVNRARGLTGMDNTRNYFLSDIPWDSYNIDRVDISRGPNSFLFGVGSPSGISNNSTYEGVFQNKGSVELKIGSYGTHRESLDYNHVLLPKELALRVDLLNDDTKYQQDPAFNHSKRAYGALRYDPKFLSTDSSHTTIKINGEMGRVRSNNPRTLPPLDYISGYFDGVVNKAGYDPFDFNGSVNPNGNSTLGNPPGLSPWVNQSSIQYIWPGPAAAFWYDSTTGALVGSRTTLNGGNGTSSKPLPTGYLSSLPQTMAMYTTGFNNYARVANSQNPSLYPGAAAGTVVYSNKTLKDPSIFDFYNKLIDGDNKREWQNWDAFNAVLDQSFLNGRLSFQATYDHQDFDYGSQGIMSGGVAPFISVDLNAYNIVLPGDMPGSEVNQNVGRPFIGGNFGASNSSTRNTRDNAQILVNGELRASDFMDHTSTAAYILGTHSFTGLAGKYRLDRESRSWSLYNTDVAFANTMGEPNGLISSLRGVNWVSYLGPSMINRTSASGLNLSNLANLIQPTSGTIRHFNNTWNKPTDPLATGYVDPNATWSNPANPSGSYFQRDNPANFVGWTNIPVNILNADDNINQLYQSGTKSREVLRSKSFMYQGTMVDGIVMPMFGYREDEVSQTSSNAPLDPYTSVASMNYQNRGIADVTTTKSKSYGLTLHLPKSLRGNLPFDSDVSLHYFHGSNGTPKVRYGFDAKQLPAESGETDDISVQVSAFKDRFTLRATYFKTTNKNAAATSGAGDPLGANGYYLYLLPAWGAADAAATGQYVANPANNGGSFTTVSGTTSATALQIAAVADWQANFHKVVDQSFFDSYGIGLNVNAITSGNFSQVMGPGKYYPWDISNTGAGKVNGTFPIISQDIESKGWEIESTIRPVDNWNITFNVSKVDASQVALGQSTVDLIMKQKAFFDGPAGLLPLWGYWNGAHSDANSLRYTFYQNIYSAYLLQSAQTGTAQPELRNWSAKAITNYSFVKGALKGVNVGGGYRWASKPILGYGISEVTDAIGNKMWLQDVNKPLRGKIDEHLDLWVGYQRKVSTKVNWRIQLNLQNVFEDARLAPVSLQPTGEVAQSRIMQGQTWTLTNTFSF